VSKGVVIKRVLREVWILTQTYILI